MEGIAKNVRPARSKRPSQLFSAKAGTDAARQDLLRRFTPTPHSTDLQLMHRTVRLETNNEAMLTLALNFFERHQHGKSGPPEFLWRIVCESDPRVQTGNRRSLQGSRKLSHGDLTSAKIASQMTAETAVVIATFSSSLGRAGAPAA